MNSFSVMKLQKIKVGVFVFASLFLLTLNLCAQDPNFYIFLCFGQSNMEGQGTIEKQDLDVDKRFKVLQAMVCGDRLREKGKWYTAIPPTCQCYSKLSPADYFGRTMVENLPDSITIGIINVSVSACDIRLFDKDLYQEYHCTHEESWYTNRLAYYDWNPYKCLIDLAKLAQKDGVIKGILLHQGETNTGQIAWISYVRKIYYDMLNDLSLKPEDVPLLAGELVSAEGNCCSSMNSIIRMLPKAIPTAYVIPSEGGPAQDKSHFNSEGYRILGTRYAIEMLSLMGHDVMYYEK